MSDLTSLKLDFSKTQYDTNVKKKIIPNDFEIIDPNDEVFMFKNNKIKEDLVEVDKNVKKVNEKVQMIEKMKN